MTHRFAFVGCLALALLLPAATPRKVVSLTLDRLARTSDTIVLATVRSVEEVGRRERVATAVVERTWKGKPGKVLEFRAHGTWTCDISTAIPGERVVLFLTAEDENGLRGLMHSGRGRMPLVEKEEVTYLGIWSSDVRMPKGTPSLAGRFSSEKLFELATVERLVRATVKAQREEERSSEGK